MTSNLLSGLRQKASSLCPPGLRFQKSVVCLFCRKAHGQKQRRNSNPLCDCERVCWTRRLRPCSARTGVQSHDACPRNGDLQSCLLEFRKGSIGCIYQVVCGEADASDLLLCVICPLLKKKTKCNRELLKTVFPPSLSGTETPLLRMRGASFGSKVPDLVADSR